jgi:hypothetical protein
MPPHGLGRPSPTSKTVDVARRPWVRIPSLPPHLGGSTCGDAPGQRLRLHGPACVRVHRRRRSRPQRRRRDRGHRGVEGREFPNGRVMFASVTVGAYKGFAHVRVDEGDLAALQRLIFEELWAERVLRPGAGPHRRQPDRGDERGRPAVRGHRPVPGRVGHLRDGRPARRAGDSLDAVDGPVLDVIRGTPGVVWTKTSFTYSEPWQARP